MRAFIRSTGKGESLYVRLKLLLLASFAFLTLLLVYTPDIVTTAKTFSLQSLSAPVHSHPQLTDYPFPVTIRGYLVLLYLKRFFALFGIGLLVFFLVEFLKNTLLAAVFALILVWLPYLLYYQGIQTAVKIGFPALLGGWG